MNANAKKTQRLLFVCMGNICRSPAAEIIFRRMVADAGRDSEFIIDSAGTIGYHQGAPPDPRMAATLGQHGYPVAGRARQVRREDLDAFDLILAMDESNTTDVRRLAKSPAQAEKVRPFVEFCREHDDPHVPDPYYGGQQGFEHVVALLEDGCRGILEALPE